MINYHQSGKPKLLSCPQSQEEKSTNCCWVGASLGICELHCFLHALRFFRVGRNRRKQQGEVLGGASHLGKCCFPWLTYHRLVYLGKIQSPDNVSTFHEFWLSSIISPAYMKAALLSTKIQLPLTGTLQLGYNKMWRISCPLKLKDFKTQNQQLESS